MVKELDGRIDAVFQVPSEAERGAERGRLRVDLQLLEQPRRTRERDRSSEVHIRTVLQFEHSEPKRLLRTRAWRLHQPSSRQTLASIVVEWVPVPPDGPNSAAAHPGSGDLNRSKNP